LSRNHKGNASSNRSEHDQESSELLVESPSSDVLVVLTTFFEVVPEVGSDHGNNTSEDGGVVNSDVGVTHDDADQESGWVVESVETDDFASPVSGAELVVAGQPGESSGGLHSLTEASGNVEESVQPKVVFKA